MKFGRDCKKLTPLTIHRKYATFIHNKNLFPADTVPGNRRPLLRAGRIFMGKIIKNTIVTILLLTLSASTAFLAYLHFFASDDKDLSGEWTANLDMSENAAVAAYNWLEDIEAVSVSLEDIENDMQWLTVQVNLTFEQTDSAAGTFQCYVSPESYDACKQAAYEAFAGEFRELLAQRLYMAGYTDSTNEEEVEALVTETFGMDTVSYLMSYAPALLPSLEDLQSEYDGSGTYEVSDDILFRWFEADGGTVLKTEYFIRKDSSLILPKDSTPVESDTLKAFEPVIYTLEQTEGKEIP